MPDRKTLVLICSLCLAIGLLTTGCDEKSELQVSNETSTTKVTEIETAIVETSCAQCQFGVTKPAGCDLAIRFQDQVYFVDGTGIDDHGDAHADDGLCNCIKKARVSGKIIDGRFVAEDFEIIEDEK